MPWLTKSRFLSGLQCHKRLWFEVHQPLEEAVEPGPAILQGRSFDEVVQRLRPGVTISRNEGMPAAIEETSKIMGQAGGAPAVMYQPAFRAGNLAFIADVLRYVDDAYELIEVKATTKVKETHIPDAAFQVLVLRNLGLLPSRIFIGHVNNQFVLKAKDQYDGLLAESDVTDEVMAYLPTAAAQADHFQRVMAKPNVPDVDVGDHCGTPYACPFMNRCHAQLPAGPDYPVESLPRGGKMTRALIDEGYVDLREVPDGRLTSDMHMRVHQATVSGVPFFDAAATAELRKLTYPYAYLDFETIGFAVPEIIGTGPYEQLPFQWSVHVETSATTIRHAEYLAIEPFGDFDELAETLIAAIPSAGPIFAYNASFEQGILEKLAKLSPGFAKTLLDMVSRLVDLLPIARQAYYHRDMRGSWSIKNVMPTIDASLDYGLRGEVQEGMAAQAAFLELRSPGIHPNRGAELRAALLDYCQHDTWVMVVLRRFLCGEGLGLGVKVTF
jgi:Domain of unknown function(DUF2779)